MAAHASANKTKYENKNDNVGWLDGEGKGVERGGATCSLQPCPLRGIAADVDVTRLHTSLENPHPLHSCLPIPRSLSTLPSTNN